MDFHRCSWLPHFTFHHALHNINRQTETNHANFYTFSHVFWYIQHGWQNLDIHTIPRSWRWRAECRKWEYSSSSNLLILLHSIFDSGLVCLSYYFTFYLGKHIYFITGLSWVNMYQDGSDSYFVFDTVKGKNMLFFLPVVMSCQSLHLYQFCHFSYEIFPLAKEEKCLIWHLLTRTELGRQVQTKGNTYHHKFPFVYHFIAICIKHVESYPKSCLRL